MASGKGADEYFRVVTSAEAISLVANYKVIIGAITAANIPEVVLDWIILFIS